MSSTRRLPTLDREALEYLQESLDDVGGDFIRSLTLVFERQADELMTEMDSAADGGDLSRLQRAAHSLKGSSATLGGTRLAGICEDLEHGDGPAEAVLLRVAEAQAELQAFQSELRSFLGH